MTGKTTTRQATSAAVLRAGPGFFAIRAACTSLLLAAVAAILASCGGGGGGGSPDTLTIPDEFAFSMDFGPGGQAPLSISSYTTPSRVITLMSVLAPVTGTWTVDSGDYSIASPSQVNVSNAEWPEPYRTFAVTVTSDVSGSGLDDPDTGAFSVSDGQNTIDVTVTPSGVRLSLNGGATESLAWGAYYDMYLNTSESMWRREASLAGVVLKVIIEELGFVADSLTIIEENDDVLERERSLSFPGDPLPPGLPLGESTRTLRLDSSTVGPGADFTWLFDYCWLDDPSSSEDLIYDGTISMRGMLENTVEADGRDTLESVGFWPYGAMEGGVFYDDFMVLITEEDGAGNVAVAQDRTLVYSGSYGIMFTAE